MTGLPRIVRVAVMGIVAEGAEGELRHVELAEADRARVEEPLRRRAFPGRGEVRGDARAAGGGQPVEVAQILEAHGHAVKRTTPTALGRLALEDARAPEGALLV